MNVQMLVFSSLIILFLLNDSVMSLVSVALKMQPRIDEAKNTSLKKPRISYKYLGNQQDILISSCNSVTRCRCFSHVKTYRNEMDPMNIVSDIMTPYQPCKIAQKYTCLQLSRIIVMNEQIIFNSTSKKVITLSRQKKKKKKLQSFYILSYSYNANKSP